MGARAPIIHGCVLCSNEHPCLHHKHVEGGILALFGPQDEANNYRLAVFWASGEKARFICLALDDRQEAAYYYHYMACAGTAESIKVFLSELLRPPRSYGGVPTRPAACGHCEGQQLEPREDPFGGYWACLQCGATSDPLTVPPEILLELKGERLLGPKREGRNL